MKSLCPGKWCLLLLIFCLVKIGAKAQTFTADFTADKYAGCAPLQINFSNTTYGTGTDVTYKWDFDNGNSATKASPSAIFYEERDYFVKLTVTSGGKTSVQTKKITVYKKPTVDFQTNALKGCIPAVFAFTASATGIAGVTNNYTWDFGDGAVAQTSNTVTSHTYNVLQHPTVSLTVSNSYGCTNTIKKDELLTILPSIYSNFTSDKKILCKTSDAVQFTNLSSGPGTLSYEWNYGDGNKSTDISPSYVFNKKGIYTVSLTTKNDDGCSVTKTLSEYLNVASYSVSLTPPSLICDNTSGSFSPTLSPYTYNYSWTLDGSPVGYNGSSYYYGSLPAGTHEVKVKAMFDNCPDSATQTFEVKPSPKTNGFIYEIQGLCGAPVDVKFKDTTADATSWRWFFNYYNSSNNPDATIQAPTRTYTSDAYYYVQLTVGNTYGCSRTVSKGIDIYRPSGSISLKSSTGKNPRDNCGPFDVELSTSGLADIVSYNWNFGDGETSTDAVPKHTFSKPGSYVPSLSYTTKNGCTGSMSTSAFTVFTPAKITDFVASNTTLCGPNPATFTATTTGSIQFYNWDFGGRFGSGSSTSVSFGAEGVYKVRLIAGNSACQDTLIKDNYITVKPPFPKISGTANTCNGTRGEVTFTQSSVNATSVIWNWGDNTPNVTTPGTQTTAKHTYTQNGQYYVTLTAVNGDCSVSTATSVTVYLKQSPVLAIDKKVVCAENDQLTFNFSNYQVNNQYYYFDSYYNQYYYFDNPRLIYSDGAYPGYLYNYTKSAAVNNEVKFSVPVSGFKQGANTMALIVTSRYFGCNDTTNFVPIQVIQASKAGFQVLNEGVCYQTPISFKDTSNANGTTIKQWTWNFGDGATQTVTTAGATVSHQYASPGYYTVTLSLKDDAGCVNSSTTTYKSVKVGGPKPAFYPSSSNVQLNSTVYFYNNSQNPDTKNTVYTWDLGNATSTQYNASSTYPVAGTYKITLTAIDTVTKCGGSVSQDIIVKDFYPALGKNLSNISGRGCPPVLVNFSNNSYNYTKVTWDFGDGITADNINYASHVYEKPGKYYVTLYVYGYNGLTATYKDSITVSQPSGTLTASPNEVCIGQAIILDGVAQGAVSYKWDMGDGNILSGTGIKTTYTYGASGSYKPMLLITDASGCTGTATAPASVKVRENPVLTFDPKDPVLCLGKSVQLHASGGQAYSWSPSTGLDNTDVASPVASPLETTTYKVSIKDDLGCSNEGSTTIFVAKPIDVQLRGDTATCTGNTVALSASGATTYKWINSVEALSGSNIPNPTVKVNKTDTYTLVGYDKYNCFTDTTEIHIRARPLPVVNAGTAETVMVGSATQLNATGSSDIVQWLWQPSSYLDCVSCPNTKLTPFSDMDYTITVKNNEGCSASDMIAVKVLCGESLVRIPNAFTPNGDGNNDVFIIKGIGMLKHLTIFDRWGVKVYDRSDIVASNRSTCWDGTMNGKPLPTGTYIYYAEMQCPSGASFVQRGSVVLIR
ncbi:PKD domain-containing protein [Pinibacter soli]|uniref:PKD domain-containing protein n=1 Tax=Pinibacter soli TaxID=3044211 RepID=A0ABT6RIV5_9BACT|nr:PKD domain-containing protein [Pinibacter soli]MDI3322356.1 PKD domain-containing protein [Pinibacter soli]